MSLLRRVFCICLALAVPCFATAQAPLATINFGVAPILPPLRLQKIMEPLLTELNKSYDGRIMFRTRKSRKQFNEALRDEQFDLAVVQPYDYVQLRQVTGYRPFLRKTGQLQPIFVSNNPNVTSLDDLRRQVVAFPPKTGVTGFLGLTKLEAIGLTEADYTIRYYADQESCLQSVLKKTAVACLTLESVVQEYASRTGNQFRTIGVTEPVPQIVILIHDRLRDEQEKLTTLLLSMNDSASGRAILAASLIDELEIARDADYSELSPVFQRYLEHQ